MRWLGSFDRDPFTVLAELPSGRSLQEQIATDFDKKSFMALDSNGALKAEVYMKIAMWDQWATVNVVSGLQATSLKTSGASKTELEEFDRLVINYNIVVRTQGVLIKNTCHF